MSLRVYDVEICFAGRVLGGVPNNPDILKEHLLRTCKKHFDGDEDEAQREAEETLNNIDAEVAEQVNIFRRNETAQLCIAGYQIKAMIREAGSMLGMTKKRKGRASFRQTLQHGLFVKPELIGLRRMNGTGQLEPIDDADGTQEDVGAVFDRAGQRSIITANEFVDSAQCAFSVRVVDNGAITDKEMKQLFGLAREIGIGSKRSRDCGKFQILAYNVADELPLDDF